MTWGIDDDGGGGLAWLMSFVTRACDLAFARTTDYSARHSTTTTDAVSAPTILLSLLTASSATISYDSLLRKPAA